MVLRNIRLLCLTSGSIISFFFYKIPIFWNSSVGDPSSPQALPVVGQDQTHVDNSDARLNMVSFNESPAR